MIKLVMVSLLCLVVAQPALPSTHSAQLDWVCTEFNQFFFFGGGPDCTLTPDLWKIDKSVRVDASSQVIELYVLLLRCFRLLV